MLKKIINIFTTKCRCGSGAHPRRCKKHPWAYDQHIFEMNYDNLYDTVQDLSDEVDRLKEKLK